MSTGQRGYAQLLGLMLNPAESVKNKGNVLIELKLLSGMS